MKAIAKVYDILFKIVEAFAVIFMTGMVVVAVYSVFMRYVMHNAPRWGDEIALLCMVWFGFLSASVALKENRHIRIDFWGNYLPKKIYKGLELVTHTIGLVTLCVFLKHSVFLVQLAGMTKMTGSRLPLTFLYAAEPIGIALIAVAMVGRIGEIIAGK